MGGTKYVSFKGRDIDKINIEPELGEVQFYLKDGRVVRKYLTPALIRKQVRLEAYPLD